MKKPSPTVTYDTRFVTVLSRIVNEADVSGDFERAAEFGAEGYQLVNVIQAAGDRPAVLVYVRPSGMILVDVDVPDDARVQPVGIVHGPGNGRLQDKGGFRR